MKKRFLLFHIFSKKLKKLLLFMLGSVLILQNSLAQVSKLTQYVANKTDWKLYDVFLGVYSSKKGSNRKQFNRLLEQAQSGLIDIVISTTISRFGRDSIEVLEFLRILRACDVRIIFLDDGIDSFNNDDTLILEIYSIISEAENENRSKAITWGNKKKALQGTSKLYNRKVYDYTNDENGNLIIVSDEANVVKLIFNLYLSNYSLVGILKELKSRNIKSLTGNKNWYKGTINSMLSNEKYIGNVTLFKNNSDDNSYEYVDHHEPIISDKIFNAIQKQKKDRSNMEKGKRKSTKFSSKK